MKGLFKKIIHHWPWPLTLNERYDRQTRALIHSVCKPDSICIDIGAFRGEILDIMLKAAPDARHIAFEPIPENVAYLRQRFQDRVTIHHLAIGKENKTTSFHHVTSNPTYSGLQTRDYPGNEQVELITVEVRMLDHVLPVELPVHLIKIDVEGGELDVVLGAQKILARWHPYIIFEHGLGGSDHYGATPEALYDFVCQQLGYRICLLGDYLKEKAPEGFSRDEFADQYWKRINYYFLAFYPQA